jgi:hypothetical protein
MKNLLWGTMLLALVLVFPITTMAGVDVGICKSENWLTYDLSNYPTFARTIGLCLRF